MYKGSEETGDVNGNSLDGTFKGLFVHFTASPKERSLRSPAASAGSPHAERTVDPTTQLEVFRLHCTLTRSLIPLKVFDVLPAWARDVPR